MSQERFEDYVELIDALSKEIRRIKSAEAERLGFKGADVMCLYYLVKHPEGLTASDLARLADVSRAAMSRTVSRLAEGGLVEVGAGDSARYRAPVRLTEKGIAATRPIEDIIGRVLASTGSVLSGEQRTQMYDGLNLILERLREVSR